MPEPSTMDKNWVTGKAGTLDFNFYRLRTFFYILSALSCNARPWNPTHRLQQSNSNAFSIQHTKIEVTGVSFNHAVN